METRQRAAGSTLKKLSEDGAAEKTGVMESALAQETTTPDAGPDPAPTLLKAEGEGQLQPGVETPVEADCAAPEQTFLQEEKGEQTTEPPTGEDVAAPPPDDSANAGGEGPTPLEEEHGATALTSENASATASLAAPPADSVGPHTVEEISGASTSPRAAALGMIEPPTKQHPASPSNQLTRQQNFRASTEIVDEGKPVRGGTPPTSGTTTTDLSEKRISSDEPEEVGRMGDDDGDEPCLDQTYPYDSLRSPSQMNTGRSHLNNTIV